MTREANQVAIAARWADELAHEIKNPFHAMVINLELVKRRGGDAEGVRERAEVVEAELHRVHGLIDSVLRVVRPWPDARHADTDTVIDALLPAMRARARLRRVDYEHEAAGGPVAIPPGDLALVLLNLVDNAFDALPKEGRLRTRSHRLDDEGRVRITVADSGPGFGDLAGDPFEAGVTGREGRGGLGLAVSRDLVEAAGGSLAVEGQDDMTTLAVTLPRPA